MNNYIVSHLRNFISSLGQISREFNSSAITIVVLGITLLLPLIIYILLNNLHQLDKYLQQDLHLSIFLQDDSNKNELIEKILTISGVTEVKFVSKQEALNEFAANTEQSQLITFLEYNPLPDSIIVNIDRNVNMSSIDSLLSELNSLSDVLSTQADLTWISKLIKIITFTKVFATICVTFLIATCLLVVGNTIRLIMEHKKQEILVLKLIGATNNTIRREYLYFGMWYGLISSLLALAICKNLEFIVSRYTFEFQYQFLSLKDSLLFIMLSILLGVLGAWLAIHRQLAVLEPN